MQTVHDLIAQIDSGMRPREKKLNPKLLKNELKNYTIASTIKKLRLNFYYNNFLFILCIKTNYEVIR